MAVWERTSHQNSAEGHKLRKVKLLHKWLQEWMTSSGAGQLDGQTADAVQPSEQRQGRQDKAVRKTAYKRRRLTGIMEFSATAVA